MSTRVNKLIVFPLNVKFDQLQSTRARLQGASYFRRTTLIGCIRHIGVRHACIRARRTIMCFRLSVVCAHRILNALGNALVLS